MTTEQLIILGFLACAFLAGWVARALVGAVRHTAAGASPPLESAEAAPVRPARAAAPTRAMSRPREWNLRGAVNEGRDELGRAVRAYHAAVVRTLGNRNELPSDTNTLETLATALVALSRAVDHASSELDSTHPLTGRLRGTGVELRRLADDVMRHSREREVPAGVLDQLEQHLISAASMLLTPDRLQPRAA